MFLRNDRQPVLEVPMALRILEALQDWDGIEPRLSFSAVHAMVKFASVGQYEDAKLLMRIFEDRLEGPLFLSAVLAVHAFAGNVEKVEALLPHLAQPLQPVHANCLLLAIWQRDHKLHDRKLVLRNMQNVYESMRGQIAPSYQTFHLLLQACTDDETALEWIFNSMKQYRSIISSYII